jgi:hypothetical protein
MNNKLSIARDEFETASKAFYATLCDEHRDLVPKVPRVCPITGKHHTNPCDEYWALCGNTDFTAKKFAALLKVYPGASALQPLADVASAAHAALLVARAAEKTRKAAAKAEREAKAAYKEAHGARPPEKGPNKNASANYDALTVALAPARAEFIAAFVPAYVASAKAAFEAKKAKALAAKEAYNQRYGRSLVFNEADVTKLANEAAKAEFDSYVAKLATKIEARVTRAVSLTGSLWTSSALTVDTDAGQQVWHTSCKLNARYGHNSANGHYTAYYQFPTVQVS